MREESLLFFNCKVLRCLLDSFALLFLIVTSDLALRPEFCFLNLPDFGEEDLAALSISDEPCLLNLSPLPSMPYRALAKELTDLVDRAPLSPGG